MIIIEGTDGVGKTTFAKKLAERLNFTYNHLTRLPDEFHRFHDYIPLMRPRVVQDRFHMSEIAYSFGRGEHRDEWKMHPSYYVALDRMLLKRGAIIVVITATVDLLQERFEADHSEEMYKFDVIHRANIAYEEIAIRGELKDFVPFRHVHIRCTPDDPYPRDEYIDLIRMLVEQSYQVAAYMQATEGFNTK